MQCYLIRHGATAGNREGRYVGRTDEPVLLDELDKLRRLGETLPQVEHVFSSPLLRCRQSGEALFLSKASNSVCFPQKALIGKMQMIQEFREMDFGEFEYKNYQELNGNPLYQRFIDSGGIAAFPGGEAPQEFCARCQRAFELCIAQAARQRWENIGFSLHGGTIMAIMDAWGPPERGYFEYQVKNGGGYLVEVCPKPVMRLKLIREI